MNKLEFTKMHGAGNDFIMIDDMDLGFKEDPGLISALCEFHRGIGADGIILLRPSDTDDFTMKYFNSDGSVAEMCGNGARCTAYYALKLGIAGRTMTFSTGAGPVSAEVNGESVLIRLEPVHGLRLGLNLPGEITAGFAISGVPHAAIIVDDARSLDKDRFIETSRAVRYDSTFEPAGTNVNIVTIESSQRLVYRTYERGVENETLACGTGALGVSVIAAHLGLVTPPVECETSGGDILVTSFEVVDGGAADCSLTGPVRTAFMGSTDISRYI